MQTMQNSICSTCTYVYVTVMVDETTEKVHTHSVSIIRVQRSGSSTVEGDYLD